MSVSVLLALSILGYIGPGAGLSALGSLIALITAIVLGIVGFIWYPFKRLLRWLKRSRVERQA